VKDLIQKLTEAYGPSGHEEPIREIIRAEVESLADEVRVDALGNLIALKKGKDGGKKVMLAAHMDEIGFYVRHVDDKGFAWINPAGGFDPRNLFSRRVLVCAKDGDYDGVLNPGGKPIHISSAEDRKKVPEISEFFIDLGMDAKTAAKKIRIGDFVVMREPFLELPEKVVSKALDNRIACFVAIEDVRQVQRRIAVFEPSFTDCEVTIEPSFAQTSGPLPEGWTHDGEAILVPCSAGIQAEGELAVVR